MTVQAVSASPLHPEGLALTLIIVTTVLGTFTLNLVSLSIWFRLWLLRSGVEPNAWGWDDVLLGIGLVCLIVFSFIVSWCLHALNVL